MAELVDALVSNTNEAIRAGSIPALGTDNKAGVLDIRFICLKTSFLGHKPTFDTGELLTVSDNYVYIYVDMNFSDMVQHSQTPDSMFKFSTGLHVWKNRIKKNGSVSLLLKVQISTPWNIDGDYLPLQLEWPLEFIDFKQSILKPRFKNDPDFSFADIHKPGIGLWMFTSLSNYLPSIIHFYFIGYKVIRIAHNHQNYFELSPLNGIYNIFRRLNSDKYIE